MVGYLARHDLRLFAWWRIVAAAVVAGLLLAKLL
jgi:undecaprenyl pyrophosphate phosphatase UppP